MVKWRNHQQNKILLLTDIKLRRVSIDNITWFSVSPPELRSLFDYVGEYYQCFYIDTSKIFKGQYVFNFSRWFDWLWLDQWYIESSKSKKKITPQGFEIFG